MLKAAHCAYIAFIALLGAIIYRVRGGLAPALPRPIDQLLFALPFAAIAYKAHNRNAVWFFAVLAVTTIAVSTGHGDYMDLATWPHPTKPETLDFIVRWVFGADTYDNIWRDLFGLGVTGVAVTIPAAISLYKQPSLAIVLLLIGFLIKPLSYYLSWEVGFSTEGGEYMTGFLMWLSAAIVYTRIK